MKELLFVIFFVINTLGVLAQEYKDLLYIEIENELSTPLPKEYKSFVLENIGTEDYEYFFRVDYWYFWPIEKVKEETLDLRSRGVLTTREVAFANTGDQILYFQISDSAIASQKIFLFDKSDNWRMYYAYSMSEIINFEVREQLIEEMETEGFKNQNLDAIADCSGSLFWYAFELNTSEYDDNYSPERNQRALQIFKELGAKQHPDAAHELANYYYFKEDTDVDKTIEWFKKSIDFGITEDHYELADFILDYKISDIDQAIASLEYLIENDVKKEQALLKLSRILMRGTGGKKDVKKGIDYIKQCVENYDSYNAKSDLAFYYYKGMGVEKDVKKAYDLLKEANEQVKRKWGEGEWDLFLEKLEEELE